MIQFQAEECFLFSEGAAMRLPGLEVTSAFSFGQMVIAIHSGLVFEHATELGDL
ncbi:MAG: hypothetical protein ACQEXX_23805 [Bacillota bacterium]